MRPLIFTTFHWAHLKVLDEMMEKLKQRGGIKIQGETIAMLGFVDDILK